MKCIKFNISGKYAFFKNPEYNLNSYEYSFEHIHKPALLGILGAILGFDGKLQFKKNNKLEYYEELKNIKVAIEPSSSIFENFEYDFVNGTGYANKGNSQMIKRMCLYNPLWTIYILGESIDEKMYINLNKHLSSHKSKYPIYLGDNSFKAKISNVEEIEVEPIQTNKNIIISSIFKRKILKCEYDEIKLYLPIKLQEVSLNYEYDWFITSNQKVNINDIEYIYKYKNKNIQFI
ncbi:TPA: CRISPR-associated protein Cas5 [Clostridium perfringens]|uniref:CRISPR-associated protein Cas5 n=1 Tax=Clostridium perfringens TaxID=1502 RepID=A0A8H9QY41_CLOPF|nr:CRISPR-associated protein Cas5 [Clostridium perfringens]